MPFSAQICAKSPNVCQRIQYYKHAFKRRIKHTNLMPSTLFFPDGLYFAMYLATIDNTRAVATHMILTNGKIVFKSILSHTL